MQKLLNKWDIGLIVVTVICSVGLYFGFAMMNKGTGGTAQIYYENQLVASLSMNEDGEVTLSQNRYNSLLADLTVEVKDGKVRISKEESPNHICSKQGWTSSPLTPLVCLPNHVYVQIESEQPSENGADINLQ